MSKEIEAKPQKMNELDYLLLELNNNNDNKLEVIKTQIKAKFNKLQNENKKLKIQVSALMNIEMKNFRMSDEPETLFHELLSAYIDNLSEKGDE